MIWQIKNLLFQHRTSKYLHRLLLNLWKLLCSLAASNNSLTIRKLSATIGFVLEQMHVYDLTKNHTRATASLVSVACGRGGGGKGVGLLGHVHCTCMHFFSHIYKYLLRCCEPPSITQMACLCWSTQISSNFCWHIQMVLPVSTLKFNVSW